MALDGTIGKVNYQPTFEMLSKNPPVHSVRFDHKNPPFFIFELVFLFVKSIRTL